MPKTVTLTLQQALDEFVNCDGKTSRRREILGYAIVSVLSPRAKQMLFEIQEYGMRLSAALGVPEEMAFDAHVKRQNEQFQDIIEMECSSEGIKVRASFDLPPLTMETPITIPLDNGRDAQPSEN